MSMHSRSTKRQLEELIERLIEIREEYYDLDTDLFGYHPEISVFLEATIDVMKKEADTFES